MFFAAAGALAGAVAFVLPGPPLHDSTALAVASAVSAGMAVLLSLTGRDVPAPAYHVAIAIGTGVASAATYGWGAGSVYAPLPYLWVVLFAFYFFSLRSALVHMAIVAAALAAVLALLEPEGGAAYPWVATVLTLLVAGVSVSFVRDRLRAVIAELADAARRDPVTRLLNRRGFEDAFDKELERARRGQAQLSLIVGDLDRFKRINDEFGHVAGDETLRGVGRVISDATRGFDSAARIGGEEFALLAPGSDEHGAYILAERIRSQIERLAAIGARPLTISFGIATFPVHGQSADGLIRAADQALYAAKHLGRNRSVISSAEVPGILARAPRGGGRGHVELTALLNLAEALDVRDSGNTTHCHRVGRFAELIARDLGLPADAVERVRLAGILHDVGRVGIPDDLIEKRGPLSDGDWSWVRSHPEIGARMLETTDFDDIRTWIRAHHERPDGSGYPDGLEGDEVPLEARILAVADAYEAMTSERSYRAALAPRRAADELRRGAGPQFDPQVVEALLRNV